MNSEKRAYLELHLAVLLYGLTAILGDLISLSAITLVWWRVLLTSLSFFLIIPVIKTLRNMPRGLILRFFGIGILVGIHWITFFGSIKFSNPSVCLVCLATTSFFTSFLEPLILKEKFKWYELLLGVMIVPGMLLVVNSVNTDMWFGIGLGLISALLASIFSILNKKYINDADPKEITFIELSSAWLFICLLLPFVISQGVSFWPQGMDWIYLIVLSLLCTTLAYVLSLKALKYISAFAATLTVNLEPVYGIILAFFLLDDSTELNSSFYLGCAIIILAVFAYPIIKKKLAVAVESN